MADARLFKQATKTTDINLSQLEEEFKKIMFNDDGGYIVNRINSWFNVIYLAKDNKDRQERFLLRLKDEQNLLNNFIASIDKVKSIISFTELENINKDLLFYASKLETRITNIENDISNNCVEEPRNELTKNFRGAEDKIMSDALSSFKALLPELLTQLAQRIPKQPVSTDIKSDPEDIEQYSHSSVKLVPRKKHGKCAIL